MICIQEVHLSVDLFFSENFCDLKLLRQMVVILPGICTKINGKLKKPTNEESRNALLKIVEEESDLVSSLEEDVQKAANENTTLQPRIICVVQNEKVSTSCVVINNVIYKLPTVVKALDVSFKAHMVLNAEFSRETHNFYTFVQKHIYDISTKFDKINHCVATLLEKLARN